MQDDIPTYDMSIHSNPDAQAWAKFFMEQYKNYKEPLDENVMTTWFANAMMAMHDHMERQRKPQPQSITTVRIAVTTLMLGLLIAVIIWISRQM